MATGTLPRIREAIDAITPLAHPDTERHTYRSAISWLQVELSAVASACTVAAFDAAELEAAAFALQERAIKLELQAAATLDNLDIHKRQEKAQQARAIATFNRAVARRFVELAAGETAVLRRAEATP